MSDIPIKNPRHRTKSAKERKKAEREGSKGPVQSNAEVGAASLQNQEMTSMQNERQDEAKNEGVEYQGDSERGGVERESEDRSSVEREEQVPSSSEPKREKVDNEAVARQQSELRSERDKGYGSEYIGNEYSDIEVEPNDKNEEEAA